MTMKNGQTKQTSLTVKNEVNYGGANSLAYFARVLMRKEGKGQIKHSSLFCQALMKMGKGYSKQICLTSQK